MSFFEFVLVLSAEADEIKESSVMLERTLFYVLASVGTGFRCSAALKLGSCVHKISY